MAFFKRVSEQCQAVVQNVLSIVRLEIYAKHQIASAVLPLVMIITQGILMQVNDSDYWAQNFDHNQEEASAPALHYRLQPRSTDPTAPGEKPQKEQITLNRLQLLKALRLNHDPFNQCVTEREIYFQFNEIYVELEEAILDTLSDEAQSTFCFADYGMGKSATRLALEYKLRLDPRYEDILCVRYTPTYAKIDQTPPTISRDICFEMAIDSVIQVVERSQRISPVLDAAFCRALQQQVSLFPSYVRRSIISKLAVPPTAPNAAAATSNPIAQDGIFWPPILRPSVEMISRSAIWQNLAAEILAGAQSKKNEAPDWQQCIDIVHTLGFKQIFILIDAVDEATNDLERWLPFLATIFDYLPEWQKQHIYVKCFLPITVQERFSAQFAPQCNSLTPAPAITTIGGNTTIMQLEQILLARLDAVKFHPLQEIRLSVLVGVHLPERIETWLAEQAQGSPRRLLQLASQFLDFHADQIYSRTDRLDLLPAEWERFKTLILASSA